MHTYYILYSVVFATLPVIADIHYLYTGYFQQGVISGIEFDDETSTLTLLDNYTVTSGSSRWIAADVCLLTF